MKYRLWNRFDREKLRVQARVPETQAFTFGRLQRTLSRTELCWRLLFFAEEFGFERNQNCVFSEMMSPAFQLGALAG
jgi:hypothetical protein